MPRKNLLGKEARSSRPAKVFLNLPYENSFVDLFLAYIAGLATLGLSPHVTLEIPGGERRLDRTLQLITECRYSLHELSPIERPGTRLTRPRLNMAFELGLTVALDQARTHRHTWFVFADGRSQFQRSLSDLAGTDAYFHGGRTAGVFRELANAFVRNKRQPTVEDMQRVFLKLKEALPRLRRDAGSRSAFTARVFSGLRVIAGLSTS